MTGLRHDRRSPRTRLTIAYLVWVALAVLGSATACRPAAAASAQVFTLASGIQFVPGAVDSALNPASHLVVQGSSLVWTDAGSIAVKKMSVSGGSIIPLAPKMGDPLSISRYGQDIFFVTASEGSSGCTGLSVGGNLIKLSPDGALTTLADGNFCAPGTAQTAVDATGVYWVTSDASPNIDTISRVPITGGVSTPLVSSPIGQPIVALGLDATNLYWEEENFPDPGVLKQMPLGGGAATVVYASSQNPLVGGFAIRGTDIFFADRSFPAGARLLKASVSGGPITVLATLAKAPTVIRADDANVYWLDDTTLNAIPMTGGTSTVLAGGLNSPIDMAVNSQSLFWLEASPPSLKSVPIAGGPVTVLASDIRAPTALTLDASSIYWTEAGGHGYARVAKLPLGGGAVTTAAAGVSDAFAPVAVDATTVFVADQWTIKRIPNSGGVPEVLAVADFYVRGLATDGTAVYWIEDPFSTVRFVPVGGGPVVTLASGSGPAGPIAIDATSVYWIESFNTIKKIAKTGGAVVTLASGLPFLSGLAVDGVNVYASAQDLGLIASLATSGGPITPLALGEGASWNLLAVDGANVYWVNQLYVGRVPKTGGSPDNLNADLLTSNATIPNAIAADGTSVYWTEVGGGTIKKATPISQIPGLFLSINQADFKSGQTLTLGATVVPGAVPFTGDVYVAVQLPNGDLLFLQGDGSITSSLQPILRNWTVGPFTGPIFTYTFNGAEPVGRYAWLAAFTQPGTLNFLGGIVQAPFSFSP